MAKSIQVEVITPERVVVKEEIEALIVPGSEGYLGILPDHIAIITGLIPGVLRYRQGGKSRVLAVGGGFMEVAKNRAVILADTAERAEEIDLSRAERARERAMKRLSERKDGLDIARAEVALKRALARCKACRAARDH